LQTSLEKSGSGIQSCKIDNLYSGEQMVTIEMLSNEESPMKTLQVIGCAITPHIYEKVLTNAIKVLAKPSPANRFYKILTHCNASGNTYFLIDQIHPKWVPYLACAEMHIGYNWEIAEMVKSSGYRTVCTRTGRCCTIIDSVAKIFKL